MGYKKAQDCNSMCRLRLVLSHVLLDQRLELVLGGAHQLLHLAAVLPHLRTRG